jgi:di/tricarboxylate transporter
MHEIAFPGFKFQKFSGIIPPISNDKLRLIFFFTFCAFFLLFISNTSIVRINFGANLDAQKNAQNWPHTWLSAIAIPL